MTAGSHTQSPDVEEATAAESGDHREASASQKPTFAWWQHLLAAFVLFHVVGAVLMSAPSPEGSLRKSAWKEPTAQAEFHAWAEGVRSLGISVTDAEFEALLWDVGKEYVDIKKTILKPYTKYAHHTGARQGWRMFVAPHRNPSTLNIDIEVQTEEGSYEWRNVYGSKDGLMGPDHDYTGQWRSRQFRHNRVAKTIFLSGWKFRRNRYREFSHWIAEVAAKDFPDAKRVRIRLFRFKTLTPEEVRAGQVETGKFHNSKTFNLDKIRERQARDRAVLAKLKEKDAKARHAEEKQSEARREANERREAKKKAKKEKRERAKAAREKRDRAAKKRKADAAKAAANARNVDGGATEMLHNPRPKSAVPPMPQAAEGSAK